MKYLLECVKGETNITRLSENELEKFQKYNNKMKSIIVQCVSDAPLEILRDKGQAYHMWKSLEKKYEQKGLPGQLFLKRKSLYMKLKEGDSLERFIGEFEKIPRQLKATGVQIEDQDIVCNLLLTLPKCYETVVTVISNLSSGVLSYEKVKKRLLSEEEKRCLGAGASRVVGVEQVTFNVDTSCYRCGKRGHYKRECRARVYTSYSRGSGRFTNNYRSNFQSQRGFQDDPRGNGSNRGNSYRGTYEKLTSQQRNA